MADILSRVPGLWRRIRIVPAPGAVTAGLEDDVHRFHLRLRHDGVTITTVEAEAVRHPWTACIGAPGKLGKDLTGLTLAKVAATPAPEHCTHLRDLAILAAAHARDDGETLLDMHVADRDATGRTVARLHANGAPRLEWHLDGTLVTPPSAQAGRDLRQLSRWSPELPAALAELAHALRRAVFVSGARAFDPPPGQSGADIDPGRVGACFNFRAPQVQATTRRDNWRHDFTRLGGTPLAGFDPTLSLPRA
ncbi:MAG: DUF2889 domain-containing protein [Sphingomonadales bacterium]|nr:DUF2889 domain-containing protein [Sphingomonadales bacterium]